MTMLVKINSLTNGGNENPYLTLEYGRNYKNKHRQTGPTQYIHNNNGILLAKNTSHKIIYFREKLATNWIKEWPS
jgi:hypothetical protein